MKQKYKALFREYGAYLFFLFLLAIAVLTYGPGLKGSFLWDDEEQIVKNEVVHHISNAATFLTGSTFHSGGSGELSGIYYRPVMPFFFSLLYSFFGANPTVFHSFQLIVHVANAFLIFLLLRAIFSRDKSSISPRGVEWIAAGGSILFLVHPINVESVLYISVLQDVLCLFFGLAAVLVIARVSSARCSVECALLVLFLLIMSIFSKETGVLFILVTSVLAWIRLKGFHRGTVPLAGALAVGFYLFMRLQVAHVPFSRYDTAPINKATPIERIYTMPRIIMHYAQTYAIPVDVYIAHHWVVRTPSVRDFWIPLIFVIITVFILSALLWRTRSKTMLFFAVWLVAGVGIHMQIFPLDMTVADRWFYIAQVGAIGLGASVIMHYGMPRMRFLSRETVLVVVGVVFLTFAVRSHVRSYAWRSGYALFSTDVKANPDAYDIQNNLGVELFRRKEFDAALVHFKRSIELEPTWRFSLNNAGAVYEQKGDYAMAKKYYLLSIKNGQYYLAYENYAGILIKEKNYEEAERFIREALRYLPENMQLRYFYVWVQNELAE